MGLPSTNVRQARQQIIFTAELFCFDEAISHEISVLSYSIKLLNFLPYVYFRQLYRYDNSNIKST